MRDCEIHGARCGGEEYLPAELEQFAGESSPELNGKILMHAIDIVRHRRRLHSISELARRMDLPKSTFFRHARGERCVRLITFRSMLQQLVIFDDEGKH